ncbi:hypothetical protein R0I52_07380 [Psychrobacter sp. CAM01]|uniref:hypothetical protein n=1 Tax=Psychrobacter sp. CAM01 TaxID=3080335 RepID=UPI002935DD44|nr:hypothetical protein [Psychrobacter sp. CAM01]MDV2860527.1 hypothetical protein [Psychrobacter sp. CAM01]
MSNSIKKRMVIPSVLSVLALTMVGCGEDDGVYGSGNNNITVSSFESQSNAITRIDTTYRNGERQVQPVNIIGIAQPDVDNLESSIVLANRFEGTIADKDISVDGNIVSRPIYQKNSNNKLMFTIDYKEYDLYGVRADSYSVDKVTGKRAGVLTDLYNYSRISSKVSFPKNAQCYIPMTNSEREFVYFNEKGMTGYKNIDSWVEFIENQIGDDYSKKITRTSLGFNKQYPLASVQAYNDDQQIVATYNGVEYKGRVYNAKHVASGVNDSNNDPLSGVVDCTLVNDVAADFLEREIKRYY